jgi:hypothetical protein
MASLPKPSSIGSRASPLNPEDIIDVSIDVGAAADTAAPYVVELTAPADTPAALSSHDAAAVLRKLRQKTNDAPADSARHAGCAGTGKRIARRSQDHVRGCGQRRFC